MQSPSSAGEDSSDPVEKNIIIVVAAASAPLFTGTIVAPEGQQLGQYSARHITDWRRRICFTGSRNWKRIKPVLDVLNSLPVVGTLIVHGGCATGLDKIVNEQARKMGFTVRSFEVSREEWRKMGKRAGPARNARMLSTVRPTDVYGFVFDKENSPGTVGCLRMAKEGGYRVHPTCYETDCRNETVAYELGSTIK